MTNFIYAARRRRRLAPAFGAFALTIVGATTSLSQCTLDGAGNPCVLTGPVTVSTSYIGPMGTTSTASGVITNNGVIQINGGSGNNTLLNLSANTTLQGSSGVLTLNSGDNNGKAILQSSGGFTLTNATDTIQGYGIIGNSGLSVINNVGGTLLANVSGQTLLINGTGSLTNNGVLQANAGATLGVSANLTNLTISGGIDLAGGTYVMNNGTIQLSTLGTGGGEISANQATIILNGPNAQLTDAGGSGALADFVTNYGGSLIVEGGNNFSVTPYQNFNNYGLLVVGVGSNFIMHGPFAQDEGGSTQVDGNLSSTQFTMDVNTLLTGTGVVNTFVSNLDSTVTPGDNGTPGTLTVSGYSQPYSYAAAPLAALDILIGSAASGQLDVTGSVTLNNTLVVSSYGGFSPTSGQAFDILNYGGTLSGSFTRLNVSGLNLAPGLTASVDYSHSGEVLLDINGGAPEPSTAAMLVGALGAMLFLAKRQVRR